MWWSSIFPGGEFISPQQGSAEFRTPSMSTACGLYTMLMLLYDAVAMLLDHPVDDY